MTPFSRRLRELRRSRAIRQADLARLLGYEQSYVSALELGIKGPPTPAFMDRLDQVLQLTEAERGEVREAARASQRKLVIGTDAPVEVFWLMDRLRQELAQLHPEQIKLIDGVLRMR
ncbi:helix-turn-helix transcriptional regulator [Piscinibacter sp. XHJ-5]|uniref:helix-turn-helix domain-containing protein n=1 Tax=Piscinibacter sp. XHJ-5 TaxID=3037797 RepID=UPI002452EAE0|nr:helix-turn-helix transcriptional regulator [Piscinibacter sp. XHJ-5]